MMRFRFWLGAALASATALGFGFLWFLSAVQAEADPAAAAHLARLPHT